MMARLANGRELGDVIDELSGQTDVRQKEGMMGVITNSVLPRAECYAHGVILRWHGLYPPPCTGTHRQPVLSERRTGCS